MDYDLSLFDKGLSELKITLTKQQKGQFLRYYEYLIEKNQVMNLTAITEYEEVVEKHFLDSLSIVKAPCFETNKLSNKKLIDVGTGAGFPGIPLKIAFPELRVVLLDSLNKRVLFLNEVISMLGLKNITALHGRAEDYARDVKYRENFDFAVSRAVANLSTLSEYCIPYVKPGGWFIPYKSGKLKEELEPAGKAISVMGGVLKEAVNFRLGEQDLDRAFALIKKKKPTPKKYPRKAGLPAKAPI